MAQWCTAIMRSPCDRHSKAINEDLDWGWDGHAWRLHFDQFHSRDKVARVEIVWWKCYVHAGVCRYVFKASLMLAKTLERFYTHSTLLFQRFYEEPCHFCVAHVDFWNITYARRTMPFLSSTKSLSCLICSYLLLLYLHQQCKISTARRFFWRHFVTSASFDQGLAAEKPMALEEGSRGPGHLCCVCGWRPLLERFLQWFS